MPALNDLVHAAGEWLSLDAVPDYPQALNGLQLANSGRVERIAAAVDASLPVVVEACRRGADLLVVHHGLFWQGAQRIDGGYYRKLKLAMDHDLAIYSAHIPLDVHPELGNNACLLKALDVGAGEPFFPWKGISLGLLAEVELPLARLVEKVEKATGAAPHVCSAGPETVRRLGVITGGAGSEVAEMAKSGVDTFLTGEGPHWSYTAAEECGINVIYAGHYATETFGVQALAAAWTRQWPELEWEFLDHPTGL